MLWRTDAEERIIQRQVRPTPDSDRAASRDPSTNNGPGGHTALRKILGPFSVGAVGVGGAIGSGIFRTPGEVAAIIQSPWVILLLWLVAGGITFLQSLVNAELATRFPKVGGEYQYLKAAYGEFAAFFFGWACTLFIVGAGVAVIAAALGDFAAELVHLDQTWASPMFGCTAILLVTFLNALGLRTGAMTLNVLTLLKVAALLTIAVGAFLISGRITPAPPPPSVEPVPIDWIKAFTVALMPVFWPYTGATDAVRLAEEVRDVQRSLPRALFGTVAVLTSVYCLYNYALMCAVSPVEMAGESSVHALIFQSYHALPIRALILLASILICLGSISAVLLAGVRVTYALARDGLAFRFLGGMSANQSPVASLVVAGLIAAGFVLSRSFEQVLAIYFLGSGFLFGLTYFSLIVFRLRDRRTGRPFPTNAYRTPAGTLVVAVLILFQLTIAVGIVRSDIAEERYDSLKTLAVLAGLALLYLVWRRVYPKRVFKKLSAIS